MYINVAYENAKVSIQLLSLTQLIHTSTLILIPLNLINLRQIYMVKGYDSFPFGIEY